MDYSRSGVVLKKRGLHPAGKRLVTKGGVWVLRLLLVAFVSMIIIGSFAAWGAAKGIMDKAPDVEAINVAPSGFQSAIYDANGKKLNTLVGAGANRVYKTLDQIPDCVQKAFIVIEDERFYTHSGIDPEGIIATIFEFIRSRGKNERGASTITQQLLKNQVFEGGEEDTFLRKVERKIQEQYLAVQVEKNYTKEQILEFYLNTINLGQNTLGVETASQRYFNKSVSNLTVSEAAVIASITKSPGNNNPITHPENNAGRREYVLKYMKDQGYISKEEYDEAVADDVYSRIQAVNTEITTSGKSIYSYYVDSTINQVVEDLVEKKGYTQTQAYKLLNTGGLSIYTYQDEEIQKICDTVVNTEDYYARVPQKWQLTYALSLEYEDGSIKNYSEGHIQLMFDELDSVLFDEQEDATPYIDAFREAKIEEGGEVIGERISFTIEPQVSVTVIDQKTGAIKAVVGGRGQKTANLALNRAVDSTRQPGSLFKVLSTYLPAIDTSGYTLASVQDDGLYYYPNSDKEVHNWWGAGYEGLSSYRRGIYRSMNVVTVKALEAIGLSTAFSYLDALGFTTVVDTDRNLALALGGLTLGVSNLETTAAFASIANEGIYVEPSFYSKVVDHDGNVILEHQPTTRQVMKDSTAFLLTSAMSDVLKRPDATATAANLANQEMGVAAKTGSSSDYNDIWISGYTPYYTCTLWAGYDSNESQTDFSMYHLPMWKAIMDQIGETKELEAKQFTKPASITEATICTKCGKLAVSGLCDRAVGGSCVATEYFAVGTVPTEKCSCHVRMRVCKDSGKLAGNYCPAESVSEVVYLLKSESITQKDSKGEEVTRFYSTRDSGSIMPAGLDHSHCTVHTAESILEQEGQEDENAENTEKTEGGERTPADLSSGVTVRGIQSDGNAESGE